MGTKRVGSRLRVGVVGAGTAGPATALFLERQGHTVTLYERAEAPSPVGAGITLQPTGLSVLGQLGLLESILSQGSRIDWLDGRTKNGRIVLDLKYETLHPELFGLGIHRGALFQSLYGAVGESGVAVRVGTPVDSYRESETEVLVSANGETEPFDLLVVADGARSALREFHSARSVVRAYKWGALWTVVEAPSGDEFAELAGTLAQVFDGTRRFVGFLPTGLGPDGSHWSARPIVSLFWSIPTKSMSEFKARGAEAFQLEVTELTRRARPDSVFDDYVTRIVEQVTDSEQLLPAAYFDVVMPRPNSRRVVFLGDAAHAMSPQLGQGANLALYDAWVLSQLLGESNAVPEALNAYAKARRNHLTYYQWATRMLTPFFQSRWGALGVLRDLSMGALCRLPFFSRQGLGSMAGYKSGLFAQEPITYRLGK